MRTTVSVAIIFFLTRELAQSATSDWLSAPKPTFPQSALRNGSEGSVTLRIKINKDGTVENAKVLKSSGDKDLDITTQRAVLKWRLNPKRIKPKDLIAGRDEVVEFRQEAPIVARYPDRWGFVQSKHGILGGNDFSKLWMFAPFPSYPHEARALHQEGIVRIELTIDQNGKPKNIHLYKTSGFKMLDNAALRAVALWRAHKDYAGQKVELPIVFVIASRRHPAN